MITSVINCNQCFRSHDVPFKFIFISCNKERNISLSLFIFVGFLIQLQIFIKLQWLMHTGSRVKSMTLPYSTCTFAKTHSTASSPFLLVSKNAWNSWIDSDIRVSLVVHVTLMSVYYSIIHYMIVIHCYWYFIWCLTRILWEFTFHLLTSSLSWRNSID